MGKICGGIAEKGTSQNKWGKGAMNCFALTSPPKRGGREKMKGKECVAALKSYIGGVESI